MIRMFAYTTSRFWALELVRSGEITWSAGVIRHKRRRPLSRGVKSEVARMIDSGHIRRTTDGLAPVELALTNAGLTLMVLLLIEHRRRGLPNEGAGLLTDDLTKWVQSRVG